MLQAAAEKWISWNEETFNSINPDDRRFPSRKTIWNEQAISTLEQNDKINFAIDFVVVIVTVLVEDEFCGWESSLLP